MFVVIREDSVGWVPVGHDDLVVKLFPSLPKALAGVRQQMREFARYVPETDTTITAREFCGRTVVSTTVPGLKFQILPAR